MIKYKIDVIKELEKVGINTYVAKKTKVFGQATMKKFKDNDTSITLDNLNRLCSVLCLQPNDIIEYLETEKDKEFLSQKNVIDT